MLKNALVSALSEYISPFISAYREGYSTQHVLVRLRNGEKKLDDDYIIGGGGGEGGWGGYHGPI